MESKQVKMLVMPQTSLFMLNLTAIALLLTSFLLSLLTTGLLKRYFSQKLLDIPNDRSSHTQPTPRGGGLGFIIAFGLLTTLVTILARFPQNPLADSLTPQPFLVALTLIPLALVGIIDDQRGVNAGVRYLVQLSSAGVAVASFGTFPLWGLKSLGVVGYSIAAILTVISITAFINLYNFMDGLDGLVASTTALQLGFLAVYLHQPLWLLLAAALMGFLYWNWSPAKIFMGDVGSTVLGASVAIALVNSPHPSDFWCALPITLPLIGDATYTIIRRLFKGENIFKAHRTHLYQRLQQSGWTHGQVALLYLSLTGAIAILITTLGQIGSGLSIGLILGAIAFGEIYLLRYHHQKIT